MRALKVIYVLAIAVALVVLVIFGVEAFYPSPQYAPATAVHARNIFLVVLPLGVVFAVVGTFLQRRSGIFGSGLILGGIGTMIYAITPYNLDNILKFAGIAATLVVLIFVGYKVFFASRGS